MRFENKDMKRLGDVFETKTSGVSYDLSNLRFLHCGVDTIKQLYDCTPKPDVLNKLATHFETKSTDSIFLDEFVFKFSKASKSSGYQYILKNSEIGFTVLFKGFFAEADVHGSHLKIEVSPQAIDRYGLNSLSNQLRIIASLFADTLIASGVSCHLALDMKGLELPVDFESKLVTRAKRQVKYSGISSASYDAKGAAVIYGRDESFTFGSASGLQMSLYDKSEEMYNSDKVDFVEQLLSRTPSVEDPSQPEYKNGDKVHRLEFRFSHRIIREFENGNLLKTGELICIKESRDLVKHLRGLWLYALNNFRLQHSTTYIHPVWQKITEDVEWFDIHPDFVYSRAQKVTQTGTSKRNVAMYMGNYLKLAARKGLTAKHATNHILNAGLDTDLAQYFGLLLYGFETELEMMLYDFVEQKLLTHRLNGVGNNQSIVQVPF